MHNIKFKAWYTETGEKITSLSCGGKIIYPDDNEIFTAEYPDPDEQVMINNINIHQNMDLKL